MEKSALLSTSRPFLTLDMMDKSRSLPLDHLNFLSRSETNPLYAKHPEICTRALEILCDHSSEKPELRAIANKIREHCRFNHVFSQFPPSEDLKLVGKDGSVTISSLVFDHDFFTIGKKHYHPDGVFSFKQYSRRALELMKNSIYNNSPLSSKESFDDLFSVLKFSEMIEENNLNSSAIKALIKKSSNITTLSEVKALFNFEDIDAMLWLQIYFDALIAANKDAAFWDEMPRLCNHHGISKIVNIVKKKPQFHELRRQTTDKLSKKVDSEIQLGAFYQFLESLMLSDDSIRELFHQVIQALYSDFLEVLSDGTIAIPLDSLHYIWGEGMGREYLRCHVKMLKISPSEREAFTNIFLNEKEKLSIFETIELNFSGPFNYEEICFFAKRLPEVQFFIFFNNDDDYHQIASPAPSNLIITYPPQTYFRVKAPISDHALRLLIKDLKEVNPKIQKFTITEVKEYSEKNRYGDIIREFFNSVWYSPGKNEVFVNLNKED